MTSTVAATTVVVRGINIVIACGIISAAVHFVLVAHLVIVRVVQAIAVRSPLYCSANVHDPSSSVASAS